MADQRFFDRAGPFTLADLAAKAGGTIQAGSDPDLLLYDIAPLDQAGDGQLSFLDNRKYLDAFVDSKAAACVVHPNMADRAPSGMALILSNKPYRTYALCAQAFYPVPKSTGLISASAHIDPSAELGAQVQVDAGVVIESGACIGARTRIAANAVIGRNVVIGADSTIGACASLSHCRIGDRVTLYPGVRIGQDGFGFAMDVTGHVRVPQVGRVIIEDDVEVGANVTIDRGAGPDTVIGRGCMIDNLVQIGHNVTLGAGCVIVAQSGISGSTRFEKFAVLAAQAGVAGHLTIGAGARIAAQSGVMRDVPAGTEVFGTPAQPKRQYFRQVALLAKLARGKSGRGDEHDSGSGSE